jgi:hypothetical protein
MGFHSTLLKDTSHDHCNSKCPYTPPYNLSVVFSLLPYKSARSLQWLVILMYENSRCRHVTLLLMTDNEMNNRDSVALVCCFYKVELHLISFRWGKKSLFPPLHSDRLRSSFWLLCSPVCNGVPFLWLKEAGWPGEGGEDDHLRLTNTKAFNTCSFTSTPRTLLHGVVLNTKTTLPISKCRLTF